MNKLKVTTAILLCVSILLFSATTYSWFKDGNAYGFPTDFGGSAMPAYFESGDGTKGDPYVISKPVHLYNLAWLQYLGYFNMREDFSNGNPQNYFKLTDNIDMRGRAVPPIGTAEYPFVGVFHGNGKTVKNVYIANKKGDDLLKVYPTKAVFDASGMLRFVDDSDEVSILGLFGVTGEYNGYVTEYAKAHTAFDSSKMRVSGFYADKLHVYSKSKQTLAGLLAGYVGCDFSNLGVYRCDMSFIPSATGIQSVTGDNSVVSLYSVVGAYNKDVVSWSDDGSSGPGERNNWGGSIDMRTLNRRLGYMYALGDASTVNSTNHFKNSIFGFNFSGSTTDYYWLYNGSSNQQTALYMHDGTVLPLNIDKTAMGINTIDVTNETVVNGKYHTNDEYQEYKKAGKAEPVLDSNTGYIVGAGADGNSAINGKIRAGMRPIASGSYKGIYKSLGYSQKQSAFGTVYDKTRFEMFTIAWNGGNSLGGKYRIKDDVNKDFVTQNTEMNDYTSATYKEIGLQRYESVRKSFDIMMEGAQVVHGFHFLKYLNASSYEKVSKDVHIGGNDYSDYELIKGGLNFTVSQDGYITAVLGTFYQQNTLQTLFDLYKVERDANHKITSFTQIDKVYLDANGKACYDPADTSGKTPVISIKLLSQKNILPVASAFYFEIPVTAGDYVIGTASDSSNNNAYLMYLDIGANGSGETGGETGKPYTMDSIDFVNTSTVTVDENNVPVYTDYDAVFFKLSGVDGLAETPYVVFRRNEQLSADGKLKVVYTVISVAIAPSSEALSAPGTLTPSLDDD